MKKYQKPGLLILVGMIVGLLILQDSIAIGALQEKKKKSTVKKEARLPQPPAVPTPDRFSDLSDLSEVLGELGGWEFQLQGLEQQLAGLEENLEQLQILQDLAQLDQFSDLAEPGQLGELSNLEILSELATLGNDFVNSNKNARLSEYETIQLQAMRNLVERENRAALPVLKKAFFKANNPEVRLHLLRFAAQIDSPETIEFLGQVVQTDLDQQVKKRAVKYLGRSGNQQAVGILQQILQPGKDRIKQ